MTNDIFDRDEDVVVVEESTDSFPATSDAASLWVDPESLAMITRSGVRDAYNRSVATTELASTVGSRVGAPKEAFLKSLTFLKDKPDMPWGIQLVDQIPPKTSRFKRQKKRIQVEDVEGLFSLSPIEQGDYIKTVNQRRIDGPSMNAERALQRMNECLEHDGYLSVVVGDTEGDDILIQATIIKPKPDMTYEKMGMIVWIWGFLCIKSIEKDSIFKHTVLKPSDHIISVNDILCEGITPEQFGEIITALPLEITITVLRRKERFSGKFG